MYEYQELKNSVIKVVNTGKRKYIDKYGIPRYVKLPYWIYRKLSVTELMYNEVCEQFSPEMLLGLIVCPTYSIENIEDIEVF